MGFKSGPAPEVSWTRLLSSRLYSQRLLIPFRLRLSKTLLPGTFQENEVGEPEMDPRSVALLVAALRRRNRRVPSGVLGPEAARKKSLSGKISTPWIERLKFFNSKTGLALEPSDAACITFLFCGSI